MNAVATHIRKYIKFPIIWDVSIIQIWHRCCQPDGAGVLKQSSQHHQDTSSKRLEDAAVYNWFPFLLHRCGFPVTFHSSLYFESAINKIQNFKVAAELIWLNRRIFVWKFQDKKKQLKFLSCCFKRQGQKRTWLFFILTQKFHNLFIDSSNILGSRQWKLEI